MEEDFPEDEGRGSEAPAVAHEDIMQRLLRYQRQLRGEEQEDAAASSPEPSQAPAGPTAEAPASPEAPPAEAPRTGEPEPWVEAPTPPVQAETTAWVERSPTPAAAPSAELARRVEELEATLAHVARLVTDLRERFQDMAIAADERLGDIERALRDRTSQEPPEPEHAGPS